MMKLRSGGILNLVLLISIYKQVATENDRDFTMCGEWVHGDDPLFLVSDLKPGCDGVTISANTSVLSIHGSITARCVNATKMALQLPRGKPSRFCVFWEPLLDLLLVEVSSENYTLCKASGLQEDCCTDLSAVGQKNGQFHGIENFSVRGDLMQHKVMSEYKFVGQQINCVEEFCNKAAKKSRGANMIEDTVLRSNAVGRVDQACVPSFVVEMKEDFKGYDLTLAAPKNVPPDTTPTVHLPAGLKTPNRIKSKVVCTYFRNSTVFQSSGLILEDVVGITVENEVIKDLPEPVRIRFHHSAVQVGHTRKCVSWDSRHDNELTWKEEGCTTNILSAGETECCCNHLTYFAILVQMNPKSAPRHLEALTYITAVGCAISLISCVILFVSLCKQRRSKDNSSLVHRGLVAALFFLCLFFVLSGTIANVANNRVCQVVGGLLHYLLLSVLCWMAVEVVHTFWMIFMVFYPSPKPWVWYLAGFGVPALPVVPLACMGNIYGERLISSGDNPMKPYRMCWMTTTPAAQLSHFITNIGLLVVVVSAGCVMLFLVFWKIRNREEWKRNCVAFLSIWGLSCLFGSTWAFAFFSFENSETTLFLFCIINSLQGFFLMLRFYALERLRKGQKFISDYSSSTGSTRQHMLQQEMT